jgi:hypothetical protein
VELTLNFFVQVRATLDAGSHDINYEGRAKGKNQPREWRVVGLPRGEHRKVFMLGEDDPPNITVWWHHGMIGESIDEVMAATVAQ